MRTFAGLLFFTAVAVGFAVPASAQEKPGRYTMTPTDGGFVRLDTETGAVSFCSRKDTQWFCEPANDIARNQAAQAKPQVQLPSEQEIDRAIDELERLFKKYRERLREFDRSIASPTPAPPAPTPPPPPMAPSQPKSL
jgi:hypothetical protein